MAKILSRGLAVLVGVALALPAQAVTIEYLLEGFVSSGIWMNTGHPELGVFPYGTPASLRFEIDSAVAELPDGAADPTTGLYPIGEAGALGVGELQIGSFGLTMLGAGAYGAETPVLRVRDAQFDSFSVFADVIEPPCDPPGPTCPGVPVIHQLTVIVGPGNGALFDSDAIPTELSLVPGIPRRWEVLSSSLDMLVGFTPTSLHTVPEAGGLPAAALAALLVARASLRRR